MPTVSPQQWNTNDAITSAKLNTPINQLAAVINGGLDDANIGSVSGTKINAGTTPASAATTDSNVQTRLSESSGDFTVSGGCVWSVSSGLIGTMTAGTIYVGGKRVVVSSIASRTFTASKDTYVSIDNTGTPSYNETTNGGAIPSLPANSLWRAVVVTNGSAITTITPIQGVPYINPGSAGGTFYYRTVNGVKEFHGVTNAISVAGSGFQSAVGNITLPVGFFSTITSCTLGIIPAATIFMSANINTVSAATISLYAWQSSGTNGSATVYIHVMGT